MAEQKKIMDDVLGLCLERGVSPCQIVFDTHNEEKVLNVKGNTSIESIKDIQSINVRGIYNGTLGIYHCDLTDDASVEQIVDKVIENSASGRAYKESYFGKPGQRYGKADTYSAKLATLNSSVLTLINKKIFNSFKAINSLVDENSINEISTTLIIGKQTIINSLGLKAEKKYDRLVMHADCTLTDAAGRSNRGVQETIEYKNIERINTDYFANRLSNLIMSSFDVEEAQKGVFNVVFSPKTAATILHIADIHLSGEKVAKKESVYTESLGKDVFSPLLIILNDPFIASSQSTPFDKEGNPTEKFMAVDHGRLRCFFLDTQAGAALEIRSNGCATDGIPESQYFVVAPSSDTTFKGLFKQAGEGYVIEGFDSEKVEQHKDEGNVNIELPFVGYKISGGVLGKAVKGTLKGKADVMLQNIIALSSEREDCPKEAALCPWFLIKDVEIA